MKIFQVSTFHANSKPYYLDENHLIDYLFHLPLGVPVTIGLLVDDLVLNCVEDEVQK